MTAQTIILRISKNNKVEAGKIWEESLEPYLSLFAERFIFNPVTISVYCEKNNISLTEEEKNILFL
jgi:hypothetical protein